jgi:hypothetical protein
MACVTCPQTWALVMPGRASSPPCFAPVMGHAANTAAWPSRLPAVQSDRSTACTLWAGSGGCVLFACTSWGLPTAQRVSTGRQQYLWTAPGGPPASGASRLPLGSYVWLQPPCNECAALCSLLLVWVACSTGRAGITWLEHAPGTCQQVTWSHDNHPCTVCHVVVCCRHGLRCSVVPWRR